MMFRLFVIAVVFVLSNIGYLVVVVFGLWLVVFVVDMLVFRVFGGVEVVFLLGVGFVMVLVLGDGCCMFVVMVLWVGVVMFVVVMFWVLWVCSSGVWFIICYDTALGTVARWVIFIGALVLVVGLLVGLYLLGAEVKAFVNIYFGVEDFNWVMVSLLVDIKSWLSSRSSIVVFCVWIDYLSYLRLLVFDDFDG